MQQDKTKTYFHLASNNFLQNKSIIRKTRFLPEVLTGSLVGGWNFVTIDLVCKQWYISSICDEITSENKAHLS